MLEWIFASYWYWFALALVLLALEIVLPGIFLLWLGLGTALVGAFLLAFPQATPEMQLLALAISITLAVAMGLKWQKKLLRTQPSNLNLGLEGYVGRIATVSQDFQHGQGRVSIDDSSFTAVSNEHSLTTGQPVLITAVDNSVFRVTLQHAASHN